MEEKKRTFKQLQKEMTNLSDLTLFCKKVTEDYANSISEYSQKNVAEDNNITKKALREIMDYAIVTAVVSLETATKVLEKSIANQRCKEENSGGNSIKHHKKLIKQRNEYLAYSFSNSFIKAVTIEISESTNPLSYFKEKYNLESEKLLKVLLQRAIVENIVTDDVMEKIISRSLKGNNNSRREKYFQILRMQRIKNSQ